MGWLTGNNFLWGHDYLKIHTQIHNNFKTLCTSSGIRHKLLKIDTENILN